MIPLLWLLIAWFVLVGIFALSTLLTVITYLNYGLSGFGTYVTTAVFLGVIALVLLGTGGYLLTIDWTHSISLFGSSGGAISL